jgi:hypothetical protein
VGRGKSVDDGKGNLLRSKGRASLS